MRDDGVEEPPAKKVKSTDSSDDFVSAFPDEEAAPSKVTKQTKGAVKAVVRKGEEAGESEPVKKKGKAKKAAASVAAVAASLGPDEAFDGACTGACFIWGRS